MTSGLRVRTFLALLAAIFFTALNTLAQSDPAKVCKDRDQDQFCNGISVGAPKIFDNRTLTIMLESLSQTLAQQQTSYIDQKSVAAALANIQGFSQTETTTNTSLTTTPTPATDVKTTLNTGNVSSTGTPLPNTFQRQTDVSRASITPTAPTLDTTPTFQGFTPTYGSSASDLLSDQINLTYQIFNLRMILERALSDRLLPDGKTRRQAVLGFNVTLDPPRTANDAVAVVEITLENKDGKDLSLVSLMPQEKTYNAAALSTKSNAFGGSAVVSSFQVGFSARRRGQVFYLYRDNDTIAYERMTGTPGKITFGWMFRPVLGRRSVSPGLRQLLAIVALPDDDCRGQNCSSPCDGKAGACKPLSATPLVTSARTYWKKYDRGTLTSFEHRDANLAKKFWYELSLTLGKPQIFHDREYENSASYDSVIAGRSTDYENDLRPTVTRVTWRPNGTKNIIISAQGNNFFSQTSVALGDKTYTEGFGLTLKSNQAFDLVTTIDALVNGPGTILGRYGNGVPLTSPVELQGSFPNDGVEVESASLSPAIAGIRKIEIHLQGRVPDDDAIAERQAQSDVNTAKALNQRLKEALAEVSPTESLRVASSLKTLFFPESTSSLGKLFTDLNQTREAVNRAAEELKRPTTEHDLSAASVSRAVQDARNSLSQAQRSVNDAQQAAQSNFDQAQAKVRAAHPLRLNQLPLSSAASMFDTPVVSVNGTPLDFPYQISNLGEGGSSQVVIQAYVKDSIVSDSGGGIVKVSWPFYPQRQWTAGYRFYNPDFAFVLTRVDSKHLIINRTDGPSFTKPPEADNNTPACWELIVADAETLSSKDCPKNKPSDALDKPKPKPAPKGKEEKPGTKPKTSDCQENAGCPMRNISDYAFVATASADLPDKVVLVGPNKAIYNLTVPPLKPKDDKPAPVELNQFDSEWIQVKPSDLTPGPGTAGPATAKPPADFSTLSSVSANGKIVNYRRQIVDPKAINPKTGKPYPPTVVEIEITRALTSNPGVVQVGFFDGTDLLGTRQIHITQTQWETEGDK